MFSKIMAALGAAWVMACAGSVQAETMLIYDVRGPFGSHVVSYMPEINTPSNGMGGLELRPPGSCTYDSAGIAHPHCDAYIVLTDTMFYIEIDLGQSDGITYYYNGPGASREFLNVPGVYSNGNLIVTAVPEPFSWALMIFGLGGLGLVFRRGRMMATA